MTIITKPFKNFLSDDDFKAGHNMIKYSDNRIEMEKTYDVFGWPIDPRNQIKIFKWTMVNGYRVSVMYQLLHGNIKSFVTTCCGLFTAEEMELYAKKYREMVDKDFNPIIPKNLKDFFMMRL